MIKESVNKLLILFNDKHKPYLYGAVQILDGPCGV